MILVNIRKSGKTATSAEQLQAAAASAWSNLKDESLDEYGDFLVAVLMNKVVGVWAIDGRRRDGEDKIWFDLSEAVDAPLAVGDSSPAPWRQGQANPVKYVDTSTLRPEAAEVDVTRDGNRRVALDGWTLTVYTDGRARLSAPDVDRKMIVESAYPGPRGGNVTVRIVD